MVVPNSNCIPHSELRTPNSDDSQLSTLNSQPVLDFISSDNSLDRYDEIIDPAGWRLDSYRLNPVFQNSHQYGDIIFTLGKALITEVRTVEDRPVLFQRIQFATEVNPMARIAYGLYKHGFLQAVSVGFVPLRWETPDGTQYTARSAPALASGSPRPIGWGEGSGVRGGCPEEPVPSREAPEPTAFRTPNSELRTQQFRRKHLEQELLEVSAVAIPANPNALALGLKSGAVCKSDLRDLADLCRRSLEAAPPVANQASKIENFSQLLSLARQIRDLMKRA